MLLKLLMIIDPFCLPQGHAPAASGIALRQSTCVERGLRAHAASRMIFVQRSTGSRVSMRHLIHGSLAGSDVDPSQVIPCDLSTFVKIESSCGVSSGLYM